MAEKQAEKTLSKEGQYFNQVLHGFVDFQNGATDSIPAEPTDKVAKQVFARARLRAAEHFVENSSEYTAVYAHYYGAMYSNSGFKIAPALDENKDGKLAEGRIFGIGGDDYQVTATEVTAFSHAYAHAHAVATVMGKLASGTRASADDRKPPVEKAEKTLAKHYGENYAKGFEFDGYGGFPTWNISQAQGDGSWLTLPQGFTAPGTKASAHTKPKTGAELNAQLDASGLGFLKIPQPAAATIPWFGQGTAPWATPATPATPAATAPAATAPAAATSSPQKAPAAAPAGHTTNGKFTQRETTEQLTHDKALYDDTLVGYAKGDPTVEGVKINYLWRGAHSVADEAQRGKYGDLIQELQRSLIRTGNELKYGDDGVYGAEVTRAVKAVQQQYGLSRDGIAGINTITALQVAELKAVVEGGASNAEILHELNDVAALQEKKGGKLPAKVQAELETIIQTLEDKVTATPDAALSSVIQSVKEKGGLAK